MENRTKNFAPCIANCPAHVNISGYISLIKEKKFAEALDLIMEDLPLPSSIARICPHPCENFCTRRLKDGAVNIHQLRIFLTDMLSDDFAKSRMISGTPEKKDKKIAIIGAGPAGISSAYFLNRLGYKISIFDAMPKAGGMLRYGIPEYRLPKKVLDRDIDFLNSGDFDLNFGCEINKEKFDWITNNFDAIIIAVGLWKSRDIKLMVDKPENKKYVIDGISFLRNIAENKIEFVSEIKDKKVVVVGGGNTAIDVCRTAVRLGAKSVTNVYRRTRNEMPAQSSEIDEAMEEGVVLKELVAPLKITSFKNHKSIILQKYVLGSEGFDGRRSVKPVDEFEKEEFDFLISAVGQRANTDFFDGEKLHDESIKTNECFQTGYRKVFAIGDVSSENKRKLAVNAVADAKIVARCVDNFLSGNDIRKGLEELKSFDVKSGKAEISNKNVSTRLGMEKVVADKRKNNFDEVLLPFTEEQFLMEASRCLNCRGCRK